MIKVAEKFYDKHFFSLERVDQFFDTDLCFLLEKQFNEKPILDDEIGIIKVMRCKDTNALLLFEHLFYDYTENCKLYQLPLKFVTYISFPSVSGSQRQPSNIRNTGAGLALSQKGFAVTSTDDIAKVTDLYQDINYDEIEKYDPYEPFATKKLSKFVYGEKDLDRNFAGIFSKLEGKLKKFLSFSPTLKGMDAFDANFLHWKPGLSMKPHNDFDYLSFVNFVTYNTDNTDRTRRIIVGEFKWYDMVMNGEDLCDIPYHKIKSQDSVQACTRNGIILNVFNPKFYHEAEEFLGDGDMYTCAANATYKGFVKSNIEW